MSNVVAKLHLRSTDTAARFLATYRPRFNAPIEAAIDSAATFREVVISHVPYFTSHPVSRIYTSVVNDWGSCGRRRVERALTRLVDDGQIVRTADGYRRAR